MSLILKGIDLPKKDGEIIKNALHNRNGKVEAYSNLQKIGEAIQIPKGHGRLIDEKDVKKVHQRFIGYLDQDMINRLNIKTKLDAPTILEEE